jgi:hypothetical protein
MRSPGKINISFAEPVRATAPIGVRSRGHVEKAAAQDMIAACERFVSLDDRRIARRARRLGLVLDAMLPR